MKINILNNVKIVVDGLALHFQAGEQVVDSVAAEKLILLGHAISLDIEQSKKYQEAEEVEETESVENLEEDQEAEEVEETESVENLEEDQEAEEVEKPKNSRKKAGK